MSKQELIVLHGRIGERIKYLVQLDAQDKMANFYFGDTVNFTANDGRIIMGKIERFNQKSITVTCPHGNSWRVSPQLLKKVPTGVLAAPFKVLGT